MARILIIDDDEPFCQLLAEAITIGGNDVRFAHTIDTGKRLVLEEYFDVVFLDVVLPDGNGLDHLSEIRSVSSEPEVIILTGGGYA